MSGPSCATSGNSTPGPWRKDAKPLSSTMNGVGVGVIVGVSVGVGVADCVGVGAGVLVSVGGADGVSSVTSGGAPGSGVDTEIGVGLGVTPAGAFGSGVYVGVAVGVSVGGGTMKGSGSAPSGIVITPGVPPEGGVMMIIASTVSGVGVKVGASVRVGSAAGTTCDARSAALHPRATSRNSTMGASALVSRAARPVALRAPLLRAGAFRNASAPNVCAGKVALSLVDRVGAESLIDPVLRPSLSKRLKQVPHAVGTALGKGI